MNAKRPSLPPAGIAVLEDMRATRARLIAARQEMRAHWHTPEAVARRERTEKATKSGKK